MNAIHLATGFLVAGLILTGIPVIGMIADRMKSFTVALGLLCLLLTTTISVSILGTWIAGQVTL